MLKYKNPFPFTVNPPRGSRQYPICNAFTSPNRKTRTLIYKSELPPRESVTNTPSRISSCNMSQMLLYFFSTGSKTACLA